MLTNRSGTNVPHILAWNVCDRCLGLEAVPWSERYRKEHDEAKAAAATKRSREQAERVLGAGPAHDLDAYVGEYAHPGYGALAVSRDGDRLRARLDDLTWTLEHVHYDVFRARDEASAMNLDASPLVTFLTGVSGDVGRLAAQMEPAVPDVVFQRVPPAGMTDPQFLERFAGVYELAGVRMAITMKGRHALAATVPGQPTYELEPTKGTAFAFKGLSGFAIEFTLEGGRVTGAVVTQPWGVFTATRVP